MNVIIWVLAALAIALIIFLYGPLLLQLPLIAIEVADFINWLVNRHIKRWKEAIDMWREVFGGGKNDELP